jgi:hypothetical protein
MSTVWLPCRHFDGRKFLTSTFRKISFGRKLFFSSSNEGIPRETKKLAMRKQADRDRLLQPFFSFLSFLSAATLSKLPIDLQMKQASNKKV